MQLSAMGRLYVAKHVRLYMYIPMSVIHVTRSSICDTCGALQMPKEWFLWYFFLE